MPGSIDMTYDRGKWFTPKTTPQIAFKPVGDFDVDREGAWSTVIGALSSVFSDSPEEIAKKDAKHGMTIHAETSSGAARIALACADEAHRVAAAFVDAKASPQHVGSVRSTSEGPRS